ncbi:hypothetical protein PFLG_00435 [Plasmodium falciparum RAJ116]|uniref:Sushi domain-containing protein n=1 Tax=Plasmodium falciparum RAJ116 TaxID=580058 RepID=A0A0L0CT92_PLAFA|nr:hypothetical protein PFLG_00435 [Plasmodium falciparum RAJ116]
MKIIYHILIFLPHYNIIIKAKENKNDNFLNDNNGTYEIIKVETHICANLNEKPNPSTLLEGALIAENEAQLQKIKKKYKVTDNEICVRPTNSSYVSLIPDKKYYLLGEKIEFKCQEGYKIIGTTNIGVCTGRNIISPNITCESLTNFDDVEKDNIQKMNNIINSASKYTFYNIIIIYTLFVPFRYYFIFLIYFIVGNYPFFHFYLFVNN